MKGKRKAKNTKWAFEAKLISQVRRKFIGKKLSWSHLLEAAFVGGENLEPEGKLAGVAIDREEYPNGVTLDFYLDVICRKARDDKTGRVSNE